MRADSNHASDRGRRVHGAIRATFSLASALLVLAASSATTGAALALAASGASGAGVVPVVVGDGAGGNATCAEVPGLDGMTSSERLEVKGNRLAGTLPAGLSATLSSDKRALSWTSTFPISAVIVKGGTASNLYVYVPARLADEQLVAPPRSGGGAVDISNVTFCWDPRPPIDDPDLVALCLAEARLIETREIVSVAGPIAIVDGAVVESTVPDGVLITYDAMTELVGFVAPFEVVVAVTAASAPVLHPIDPPAEEGFVPLSSNPGDGEIVLCGLDTTVVATVSCARIGANGELGPVAIRDGAVDTESLPREIVSLDLTASAAFVSTVPVVGVIVEASEPVLYAFATPVLAGSIPVDVDAENPIDLTFCTLVTSTGQTDPGDLSLTGDGDPTTIATGGGPSGRTTLLLVAFVILALSGSSAMLLWSRGG